MPRQHWTLVAIAAMVLAACSGPASAPPAGVRPGDPTTAPATPLAGGAAAASAAPARPKLTAAWAVVGSSQLALWATVEGGYFAQEGLGVTGQRAGAGNVGLAALLSGEINVLQTSASSTMNAVAAGHSVVYLGSTIDKMVQFMVARADRADITSGVDIKGQRLGVTTPGSLSDSAANLLAHQAGLTPGDDFTIVRLNDLPTIRGAVETGAVDVGFVDTAVGADRSGLKAVVDFTRLDVPYSSIGLIASRAFLVERPAEWRAFERAVNQALRRVRDDPPFAARVLGQYLEIQDAEVLRLTADEAIGYLNGELRLERAGLENTRLFASYGIPALRDFDVSSMLP
jgi:NitT/TauT family transport system substrate-binding protein